METICIVDDDFAVRRSLSRQLREEGWNVEAYESAEEFLSRPARAVGDCLVLDVTMQGLDGLELQRRLLERSPVIPIVFVTGNGDIPMSVRAIKAGAVDFLTKPVRLEALAASIRSALAAGAAERDSQTKMAIFKDRFSTLTSREREVLIQLVKGRLNKQIASDLGIVEQTVKFHRARIMERMHAHTIAELMNIAAMLGIEADCPGRPVLGLR